MKFIAARFVAGLVLVCGAASAYADSYYVGGAIGRGRVDGDLTTNGTVGTFSTHPTGVKVYAGDRMSENLSIEVGYISFGRSRWSDAGGSVTAELSARAIGTSLAYSTNLTPKILLTGRAGVALVRTSVGASALGVSVGDSSSDYRPIIGASVGWAVNPSFAVELAWDHSQARYSYASSPGLAEVSADLDLFSLGAQFKF